MAPRGKHELPKQSRIRRRTTKRPTVDGNDAAVEILPPSAPGVDKREDESPCSQDTVTESLPVEPAPEPEITSTLVASQEGRQPKHSKKGAHSKRPHITPRMALIGGGSLVVIIVVCVLWFLPMLPFMQGSKQPASQQFTEITSLIDQADEVLSPMSDLMSKTLDDATVAQMKAILTKQQATANLLDQAKAKYDMAKAGFNSKEEGTVSENLEDAIESRQEILEYGCVVLNAGIQTYGYHSTVTDAWKKMLDGASKLKASADKVDVGTTSAVKQALTYDEQAKDDFTAAKKAFTTLASKITGVDFSPETKYLDAQIQAVDAAIATDRALLDNDKKVAKKYSKQYDTASSTAATLAKSLPANSDDLVKTIYYSFGTQATSVENAENRYAAACDRAKADDILLKSFEDSKGQ